MKKIVFLIIASLLVVGLVLPGCNGGGHQIIIAICGPMSNVQGIHMWLGATVARDKINNDGGVDIGGTMYEIKLIKVDTDEIANPSSAAPAMENAIVNKGAEFVIGGVRTEAVIDMIKVARCTTTPFFICGAGSSELLGSAPYYPYNSNYTGYRYVFRATPFNDVFLVNNSLLMTTMVAKKIETIIGANSTNPVKFAIFAENLTWADAMVESAQFIFGTVAPFMFEWPWELVGTWTVTDTQDATTVETKLNEIVAAGTHIIFTILSGPVGVTYGKLKGQLGIPCISVGINVEAQAPDYWYKTEYEPDLYGAAYEITMGAWAWNVTQTDLTEAFLALYITHYGVPVYTAASYDMIYTLKAAMEDKGSKDADDIIQWLEEPDKAQLTTTGTSGYYQLWDGSTMGAWKSGTTPVWPALNTTQRDYYYLDGANHNVGYDAGCNFTMPAYTTHDLVYGPGWETGLAVQWMAGQESYGQPMGVWPNNETWTYQNTMSRYVAGINWTDVEYPGTTDFVIPDWMCTAWTGSPCP